MSHVREIEADSADQQIRDLDALAKAADRCGLQFKLNKMKFRTWATDHGRLVGDYPVPTGYSSKEIIAGKCLHAIGIPDAPATGYRAYEIGVVESKKYPGTFSMLYDFYGGEIDQFATSGKDGTSKLDKLHMYYRIEAAKNVAAARGMICTENVNPATGRIMLVAESMSVQQAGVGLELGV